MIIACCILVSLRTRFDLTVEATRLAAPPP
jgi:hypothetical protein